VKVRVSSFADKDLWRSELGHLPNAQPLSRVVKDWHGVAVAFDSRNRLVHGRDRYTPKMAAPEVKSLLAAVSDVCAYALSQGVNINKRLPQRRQKRAAPRLVPFSLPPPVAVSGAPEQRPNAQGLNEKES
jgi:hypothetical protein